MLLNCLIYIYICLCTFENRTQSEFSHRTGHTGTHDAAQDEGDPDAVTEHGAKFFGRTSARGDAPGTLHRAHYAGHR